MVLVWIHFVKHKCVFRIYLHLVECETECEHDLAPGCSELKDIEDAKDDHSRATEHIHCFDESTTLHTANFSIFLSYFFRHIFINL